MKIRFMALFLGAFFSLIMLTGCTKDDIEKVDISEMTPEEIFELYETELNDLAVWAISYEENIRVDLQNEKLDAFTLTENTPSFCDVSLTKDTVDEIKSTMKKLESACFIANYPKEIYGSEAAFQIWIRKNVPYREYYYYYPEGEMLDRVKMEKDHEEIIDLGEGWYYMRPFEMVE